MGIKKLNSYLSELNLITEFNNLEDIINHIKIKLNKDYLYVTIDTSLYLYKYSRITAVNKQLTLNYLFKKQILKFIKNNVIPIYIFDGAYNDLKDSTIINRINQKNNAIIKIHNMTDEDKIKFEDKYNKLLMKSINIKIEDVNNLQIFLKSNKVPFIVSPTESDVLCAKLVKNGFADFCLSEDMDILIYGCSFLIKSIVDKYYLFNYNDILLSLNINSEQLCKFAILLGSDYSRCANTKIKPNELLSICKNYDFNLNSILTKIINIDIHKKFYLNDDSHILSLSELSNLTISDNSIRDFEIISKVIKYYSIALELVLLYNNYDIDISFNVFSKNNINYIKKQLNIIFNSLI